MADRIHNAAILRNILSKGLSYHVEVPLADGFGWFLYQNQYIDGASNTVPLFLDPLSSPVHISN